LKGLEDAAVNERLESNGGVEVIFHGSGSLTQIVAQLIFKSLQRIASPSTNIVMSLFPIIY